MPPTCSSKKTGHRAPREYQRYPKPPYQYVGIIASVLASSPAGRLTLSGLIEGIKTTFPFFNGPYTGWKDSIRHNLSNRDCFEIVLKHPTNPRGKGNFWTVKLDKVPVEAFFRQDTKVMLDRDRAYAACLLDELRINRQQWPFSEIAGRLCEHRLSSTRPAPPPASSSSHVQQIGYHGQGHDVPSFSIERILSDDSHSSRRGQRSFEPLRVDMHLPPALSPPPPVPSPAPPHCDRLGSFVDYVLTYARLDS